MLPGLPGRVRTAAGRTVWGIAAPLFYLGLAILFTWPLLFELGSRLPLGSESSATLPLFNLWTLSWNADRAAHLFSGYWDAPIFHPQASAFGLSDPMPATGLLFAVLRQATSNPFLAYNLCLLAILVLNGVAAARLAGALGAGRAPASLTGLLAVGLPWVSNELGVIQMTVLFPVLFALAALVRFLQSPGCRRAVVLGLWAAGAYLTSNYFGVYLTLFMLLAGALLVRRDQLTAANAKRVAAAGATCFLLLAPVMPGQLDATAEFSRNEAALAIGSAVPEHFLKLRSRAAGLVPWLGDDEFRDRSAAPQRLYPGTALSLLGLAGVVLSLKTGSRRRYVACFAAFSALAFLLSFGPRVGLFGISPYEWLRQIYPGFSQMRSSFRLAAFMQVGLLAMAAIGLELLWDRRGRAARFLAVALAGLGLAEVLPPAQRFSPGREEVYSPGWVEWLRQLPPGPVAFLPPSPSGRAVHFEPVLVAMLQGLEFEKPLLNGYSGYFPDHHREFRLRLRKPTSADIDYLRDRGARYLLLDLERASPALRGLLRRKGALELLFETGEVRVYGFLPPRRWTADRVVPPPGRTPRYAMR